MKYLLCILLPPLAVLLTSRPFSALLNLLLTLCFWVPGVIHAMIVVNADRTEERHAETLSAITGKHVPRKRSEEMGILYAALALVALLVVASLVYTLVFPPRPTLAEPSEIARTQAKPVAPWRPSAKHTEFIEIIKDVYDVESAEFVRDDYLQVTFAAVADEEPQGTCQAIANLWAFKQPQPQVIVDAYSRETRIAHATVFDGQMITPPPPTGRRSVAGEARSQSPIMQIQAGAAPESSGQEETFTLRLLKARAALEGKTFAEVEGTHGPALSKDKDTGWATWPKFKAQFQAGKVVEVELP